MYHTWIGLLRTYVSTYIQIGKIYSAVYFQCIGGPGESSSVESTQPPGGAHVKGT